MYGQVIVRCVLLTRVRLFFPVALYLGARAQVTHAGTNFFKVSILVHSWFVSISPLLLTALHAHVLHACK